MATAAEAEKRKTKKGRSPSYPGIDLEEAIQRAETLYQEERKNAAPVGSVLAHWGFTATNSQGLVVLAALKKFGLLEDEGDGPKRTVRLSKEGLSIVVDQREDSTDRAEAIQRAALAPAIHKAARDRYGAALPSDATLRHWLLTEKSFTERGADEFIPQYRSTIRYARLDEAAKIPEGEGDKPEPREELPMMQLPTKGTAETRIVPFPIRAGVWGRLEVPSTMTETDWERMLESVKALRIGFVAEPDQNDK